MVSKSFLTKTLLSIFLLSSSMQMNAWNEQTIKNGVLIGAGTKLLSYALVRAKISPEKAALPSLLFGALAVATSESPANRKTEEFLTACLTWALLTLAINNDNDNQH